MPVRDFIQSIRDRDPAAPTAAEVIFCYPGFHVLTLFHPPAHWLWGKNLHALARFWSQAGRFFTGIEIHPQARIGRNLFIDHGMGVVIGQTATVGDNVTLYHGVTLGGKGGDAAGAKRHPDIGNNVVIGAGAQVLGAITVGDNAAVGANAVVTHSVPDGATIVGNPGRRIEKDCRHGAYGMPVNADGDPVGETITGLLRDVERLKQAVNLPPEPAAPARADGDGADYAERWMGSGI
jgi:serine O-acetyltransferase